MQDPELLYCLYSMTSSQNLSKNSLSAAKAGFAGSGHCEDCVVPIRACIWLTLFDVNAWKWMKTGRRTWGIIEAKSLMSLFPWFRRRSPTTTQWEISAVIFNLPFVSDSQSHFTNSGIDSGTCCSMSAATRILNRDRLRWVSWHIFPWSPNSLSICSVLL